MLTYLVYERDCVVMVEGEIEFRCSGADLVACRPAGANIHRRDYNNS